MEFSIRRVNALFKKEIKDFGKNVNVSIMCILPIIICFLYSKLMKKDISTNPMVNVQILTVCISLNISLIATFIMGMLIAEEKEKNTLRTLMLSAVSPWEFLAGKALISFVVTEVVNVVLFFIVGMDIRYLGKYMIITTLVVLSMLLIGAIIGIISPNQMATGVTGIPVMIIFYMLPMFTKLNDIIKIIVEYLPNHNMNIMLEKMFNGEVLGTASVYSIAVILIWIIIAGALFMWTYNKRGLDK